MTPELESKIEALAAECGSFAISEGFTFISKPGHDKQTQANHFPLAGDWDAFRNEIKPLVAKDEDGDPDTEQLDEAKCLFEKSVQGYLLSNADTEYLCPVCRERRVDDEGDICTSCNVDLEEEEGKE